MADPARQSLLGKEAELNTAVASYRQAVTGAADQLHQLSDMLMLDSPEQIDAAKISETADRLILDHAELLGALSHLRRVRERLRGA